MSLSLATSSIPAHDAAVDALLAASLLAPEDAAVHAALGLALRAAGRDAEAVGAELASIALGRHDALMYYNLGTSYLMTQRPALAVKWYRLALRVDPELVAAHQNLATILELDGCRREALYHRDQAYRRQNIFIDGAPEAPRTVLVLCTAGTGNVPIEYLLAPAHNRRVKWVMEYATLEQAAQLPPYDLVFNAIGDADVSPASREVVRRFLSTCEQPLLNAPAAVARTSRDLIPALLGDIEDVLVPPVLRLPANGVAPAKRLAEAGMRVPLLLRPVGSHGGRGLQKLDTAAALAAVPGDTAAECYASAYHDYRSADGHYRKFRVIFVDRQPYAYHLAIAAHWLLHYTSADMLAHPWKRDEERRFLADPAGALGARGMAALGAIGARLDLDFAGVDFALLPDGRLLLFEANATMLVHTEDFHDTLKAKNPHVRRILDAFDAMLAHRQ